MQQDSQLLDFIFMLLKDELANASLVIVKGDANYRRLLGDVYDGLRLRHWDLTTNIADIVCYLPVPMLALRTLKSEIAVGLKLEVSYLLLSNFSSPASLLPLLPLLASTDN